MKAVVLAYHNMGIAGLDALFQHDFEIAAIFTHEDDPQENCWFGSVKDWALKHDIPCYTTESINSPEWVDKIASLKPDVIFSVYYRKMIGRAILDIPRLGAMNLHGSLLPAYRGRCPVNWVLVKGEHQTGVTLHFMVDKPDAGDIVGQQEVNIDFQDTARTLYDKLCAAAGQLLNNLLPVIKTGQIPSRKQDLTRGSYYGGRRPEDGRIDWTKSAVEIYNLIRAVTNPYPGAFSLLENDEKIIVWRAEPAALSFGNEPGDVEISGQDVLVKTGIDAIRLLDVEISGKRMIESQICEYFKTRKVIKLK
ncbi:MAG: formyltransferase [Deltaproteobacteria bacterium HGW-Deltaproteobacteria-6]|jgi:UDP-4-amino-4-deoxy-L-arabinose formyltransferase/UDP-glucuronic acid dehydrogenase (UDP-4-keto-hexauronic acid decarboxylating)|nr:MAG: formyltransferase [Deltaproteobacteria bacterium HGW-Deltaproteobacteria-6]